MSAIIAEEISFYAITMESNLATAVKRLGEHGYFLLTPDPEQELIIGVKKSGSAENLVAMLKRASDNHVYIDKLVMADTIPKNIPDNLKIDIDLDIAVGSGDGLDCPNIDFSKNVAAYLLSLSGEGWVAKTSKISKEIYPFVERKGFNQMYFVKLNDVGKIIKQRLLEAIAKEAV